MMKKNKILLVLGCLSLGVGGIGIAKAVYAPTKEVNATATAGTTYTFDFATKFSTYADKWGTSYSSKTLVSTAVGDNLPTGTFSFGSVNKSTATITTVPVSKASENTFELTESGFQITSVEVGFLQWSTKTKSAMVYIDGGSATPLFNGSLAFSSSAATTGSLAISDNGVTKIHFDGIGTNQVGYSYLKITVGALVATPKIAVSQNSISLPIGGSADSSITATASNFSGDVTWEVSSSDETAATATISSAGVITITPSATLSAAKAATLTVTAKYSTTETASTSISLNIGQTFTKITSIDSIAPGSQIIFQDTASSYVRFHSGDL
jgi:hypothetical protein